MFPRKDEHHGQQHHGQQHHGNPPAKPYHGVGHAPAMGQHMGQPLGAAAPRGAAQRKKTTPIVVIVALLGGAIMLLGTCGVGWRLMAGSSQPKHYDLQSLVEVKSPKTKAAGDKLIISAKLIVPKERKSYSITASGAEAKGIKSKPDKKGEMSAKYGSVYNEADDDAGVRYLKALVNAR